MTIQHRIALHSSNENVFNKFILSMASSNYHYISHSFAPTGIYHIRFRKSIDQIDQIDQDEISSQRAIEDREAAQRDESSPLTSNGSINWES